MEYMNDKAADPKKAKIEEMAKFTTTEMVCCCDVECGGSEHTIHFNVYSARKVLEGEG